MEGKETMGRRRIRGLEARVGQKCSISIWGTGLNNRGIQVGGVQGGSHSVTMRCNCGSHGVASRDAAGVRAAKSSEFGEGELVSTLDGPIWSKYSIALTYLARSHFQCTLSKERRSQCWDKCYDSSRKEKYGDEDWQERGRRKEEAGD